MIFEHEGKHYDLPDDISDSDLNSFFASESSPQQEKSTLRSIYDKIAPNTAEVATPRLATGLISAFLPEKYKSAAQALPGIATGAKEDVVSKLETGAGQYIPYLAGGIEGLVQKGISAIPKLGESKIPAWLATQAGTGGVYGATQDLEHPIEGGLTGAVSQSAIGTGIKGLTKGTGLLIGSKNTQNEISNYIAELARKNGLSSEDAVALMAGKYTTAEGKEIPVDIGELSGNPMAKALSKALSYMPGTGMAKNKNLVTEQLHENKVNEAVSEYNKNRMATQQELKGHQETYNEQSQLAQEAENKKQELLQHLGQGAESQEEVSRNFAKDVKEAHDAHTAVVAEKMNPVIDELGDKLEIYQEVNPSGYHAYRNVPEFDLPGKDMQTLYKSFSKKPTLRNAHALQQQVGYEIGRIKKMPNKDRSTRDELSNLNAVYKRLNSDIDLRLKEANPEMAAQWKEGRQYHKENVIPYRSDSTLRKIVEGEETNPKNLHSIFEYPTENIDKKTKEYTSGAIQKVLADLPENTKNKIVFSKLGSTIENPKPRALVKKINTIKSTGYSEHVTPEIEAKKQELEEITKQLSKKKINESSKRIDVLQKKLEEAQSSHKETLSKLEEKRLQLPKEKTLLSNKIAGLSAAGLGYFSAPALVKSLMPLLVGGAAGRTITKAITSPEARAAYIHGVKAPVNKSLAVSLMENYLPMLGTQQIIDSRNR